MLRYESHNMRVIRGINLFEVGVQSCVASSRLYKQSIRFHICFQLIAIYLKLKSNLNQKLFPIGIKISETKG